jgi:hypothetical protein
MFTESKKFYARFKRVWLWCATAVILCLPATTFANEQFSPAELDTLVSTIALYPDPLLVQVLAASVHGDEIPGAADWANQHKHLKGQELADRIKLEELPYDESVQALIPFPTVLATMAKYQVWTDQLGDAVATQKEAVMDAVQRMRNAAYNHGHLQSNEQVKIIKEKTIVIEPVQKEYVYVPVYNPHVVYYVYSNGYPSLRYRSGVWIGSYYDPWGWNTSRFEWDTHLIYVHDYRWYHNRPRPRHPPRHYHYGAPPHRKVPMNHHTTPVSHYNKTTQPSNYKTKTDIQRDAAHTPRTMTIRNSNDEWQDDYAEQNKRQNFGNVNSTRSSGSSNRCGGSRHGGFGKSIRK